MKLSIVIKSQSDFELILPLCSQIEKIQKEGKYLFYRFICLCHEKNHTAFKKCMKKFNINVPYTFLELEEKEVMQNQHSIIQQMEDEMFRNPIEALLMIGWNEFNKGIIEIAIQYKIKILLLDSMESQEMINGNYDYIFSTSDPDCWKNIVETIIKIYKL